MRVLHLPKWYPHRYDDQDGDFVARHVAAIATAAPAETSLQTAVVFAAVARGPLPGLIAEEVDLTSLVPTWRYYYRAHLTGLGPLDRPLKLLLWAWCMGRGLRAVRRHWRGRRPDLLHAHVLLRTGLLAWLVGVGWRIPYVISEHWTLYLPPRAAGISWRRRVLSRAVVRRAAALHTVSEGLRAAMAALGLISPTPVVIANVVDTALFRPRPAPALAPTPPVLLHVAAFHEEVKNLSGVLRVVAGLRPTWPGLRLRIAGYGPDEARLHAYAATLGLLADAGTATATFLGKLPHAAVAAEMAQATALVSFSRAETFGCVLLEARACGCPVVATRTGGVPELFQPENTFGLLVPPDDEAALAAALTAVLGGATRFEPARLRADAAARCAPAVVGRAFRDLYRQVLAS